MPKESGAERYYKINGVTYASLKEIEEKYNISSQKLLVRIKNREPMPDGYFLRICSKPKYEKFIFNGDGYKKALTCNGDETNKSS